MTPPAILNAKPYDFVKVAGRLYARLLVKTIKTPEGVFVSRFQYVRWNLQRNQMVPRDRKELRKFRTERARAVKLHLQTQPHPQPSFV